MAHIAISVMPKVKEYLVGPTSHCVRSLFCFNQFIGDVGNAKAELESKLAQVKERQEEAARKTEEIMPPVKKWLDDVEAILQDVHKLQQEVEAKGKKCFNVSLRYSLAERMEKKAKQMMELKRNSNFEPFSHPIPLPSITYFTSKEFVSFGSRKSTYNQLLEAIKDGKNKMVGLCGMWGSGKTTMAKEVGKKLVVELKLFNKVVVVDVPQDVENIQEEIAEQTGLKIQEEAVFIRASKRRTKLKYTKILIILDDVTSNLSLKHIGITLDEGCCILLTTRFPSLCDSMGCDCKIELPFLTKEEAWTLLKMHANITSNSSNEFDSVGRQIVDECKGLPMTVVAVGSTLKGKRFEGWVTALWRLQHSQPLEVEEDLRTPYACIKFNYDNLPSPTAKSLFLMCSMFPVDCRIHKEDLIRFGKGMLKLDESVDTMEDARREILLTINKLIDSCLIMSTYKQAYVKMHDVVGDVALLIAKKRHKAVLVESHEVSKILEKNESVKYTKIISLCSLEETYQLRCPTLEILLLHPSRFIDDFGGVKALKVLAVTQFSFTWSTFQQRRSRWSMPQSIVSLTNLHTLCLRGIALYTISFLYKLKGLEILDLRGSSFYELPIGIEHMKKLKLLDLFGCSIEKKPYGVIQKCAQLQELYLWDEESTIPENFSVSGLKRYVICDSKFNYTQMGSPSMFEYLDGCVEALRALSIEGRNVSVLSSQMKDLIFRANILWLDDCRWDNKDISSEIKHLVVSRCPEKKVIFDNLGVQTEQVFSHLITLSLVQMSGLEQVFASPNVCFPKLLEIKIAKCNKVKWAFSYSVACHCPSLEKLEINVCSELEGVVAGFEGDAPADDWLLFPRLNNLTLSLLPKLRDIFPNFEYKDSPHHIQDCPKIMSFHGLEKVHLNKCTKVRTIFTGAIIPSLPALRQLDVNDCEEWEGIFSEDSVKNLSVSSPNVCFPKLSKITIASCDKVKRIFPYDMACHCPSLEILSIRNCGELEGVVEGFEGEATGDCHLPLPKLKRLDLIKLPKLSQIFPAAFEYYMDQSPRHTQDYPNRNENNGGVWMANSELCYLWLQNLAELEYIWRGPTPIVSLHRLEEVELYECTKLRTIFTGAIIPSLPELRKLKVSNCDEWEGIMCEDSLKNLSVSSPNVCFPKLLVISIHGCNKVKRVFSYSLASHCPSLVELQIWNCRELEGVVVVEGFEAKAAAANDGLLFPKLKDLALVELPKVGEIYPGYDFNHRPSTHRIIYCPNIYV